MNKTDAENILKNLTKGDSLLRHARTVAIVMERYARHFEEDEVLWYNTGLLHDADYEAHPEEHPNIIVKKLRDMDEEAMAHAISAHYTKWGVSYDSLLDKALLACDELTGFIVACCQVRPDGINSLEPKSVVKKLKQKSFAASVEREEVHAGVEMLGVDLKEHISFIIEALKPHKEELKIG